MKFVCCCCCGLVEKCCDFCCFKCGWDFYAEDYYDDDWKVINTIQKILTLYPKSKELLEIDTRFEWISLFYVLRVIWRVLEITSHIFLLSLIWLIIGGYILTFKVIIESAVFLGICLYTGQWEFLFGIIGMVLSTTTDDLRKLSIWIAINRMYLNIVWMILLTIWLFYKTTCWKCTEFSDRKLIVEEKKNTYVMFIYIYTWIAVILSPICAVLLYYKQIFRKQTSTSRDLQKMIVSKNYNGIIELQLYRGQNEIYNIEKNKTLLMLAMQQNYPGVVSFLLNRIDKYDDLDVNGLNILDYYVRLDQDNDIIGKPMLNSLLKIYEKYPTMTSKQGLTVFLLACWNGELACVKKLLENNKLVLDNATTDGLDAATLAKLANHDEIVEYLKKEHNVQPEEVDIIDMIIGNATLTPLLYTIYQKYPSLESKDGHTSFACAAYHGDIEIVQKIVEFDRTLLNNRGELYNAIFFAKQNNYQYMVQHLQSYKNSNDRYVLMLGASPGAGSTTMLYNAHVGVDETVDTALNKYHGVNIESIEFKNINFIFHDVPFHQIRLNSNQEKIDEVRYLSKWNDKDGKIDEMNFIKCIPNKYINEVITEINADDNQLFLQDLNIDVKDVQLLVFVLDSTDRLTIDDKSDWMNKILNEFESMSVKLNKTIPPTLVLANKQDVPTAMTVNEVCERLRLNTWRGRQWYIQSTCAHTGEGFYEGLDWYWNNCIK
eukprot:466289_1